MFGKRGRRWAGLAAALVTGGGAGARRSRAGRRRTGHEGLARAVPGTSVTLKLEGRAQETSALALELKDGTVPVYCIDFHTPVARDGEYAEGTWSESEVKNLGQVQWVLRTATRTPTRQAARGRRGSLPIRAGDTGATAALLRHPDRRLALQRRRQPGRLGRG